MHFLIGSVASAIHNKDLQSLETLLKMFLYEVELLHAFVYEEWMDGESLTAKIQVTIQQTNNTTRYGGMTKSIKTVKDKEDNSKHKVVFPRWGTVDTFPYGKCTCG